MHNNSKQQLHWLEDSRRHWGLQRRHQTFLEPLPHHRPGSNHLGGSSKGHKPTPAFEGLVLHMRDGNNQMQSKTKQVREVGSVRLLQNNTLCKNTYKNLL
jgi:hypothetical protein